MEGKLLILFASVMIAGAAITIGYLAAIAIYRWVKRGK